MILRPFKKFFNRNSDKLLIKEAESFYFIELDEENPIIIRKVSRIQHRPSCYSCNSRSQNVNSRLTFVLTDQYVLFFCGTSCLDDFRKGLVKES